MLLGIWRNIEELELSISMDELNAILEASRKEKHEQNKFLAALKGIDLDAPSKEDIQARFDAAQRRAAARLRGVSEEVVEFEEMGLDIETD